MRIIGEVDKIVQLRIVDGKLDRKKTKIMVITDGDDGWSQDVAVSPLVVPDESDVEKVFEDVLDMIGGESRLNGCVKTWDGMYEVRYDGEELKLEYLGSSDTEICEFGKTLKHRWISSPNLREVFEFLSSFSQDDEPYTYLSSEMILKGLVFPGGSFYYYKGEGVCDGEKGGMEEVLDRIFDIYLDEKGGEKAVVAVSSGEKSRILLEMTVSKFTDVETFSFWKEDGCETAEKYGVPCRVVKNLPRNADSIQAFLILEAGENAVAIWGADRDFLKRHSVDVPQIFTPFWFMDRKGLAEHFGFQDVGIDDVLQEVF